MSKRLRTLMSLGVLVSVAIIQPGLSMAQVRTSDQAAPSEIDHISRTSEARSSQDSSRSADYAYNLNHARDVARELHSEALIANRDGDTDKACTLARMTVESLIDGGFEARDDLVRQYQQRMRLLCTRAG
jgi:membrane-associated HD superfamily phosphohydrolase